MKLRLLIGFLLWLSGWQAVQAEENPQLVPVGIFVTSIHDLDFATGQYEISAWLWATYDPTTLPDNYVFYERIEIINARAWEIIPGETFIINKEDGRQHAMAKIRATLSQDWDTTYFPFDQQTLEIKIESVELDSSRMRYVADRENSNISDDFTLNDWLIKPMSLVSLDYQYATTFGLGEPGVYPRLNAYIPIERYGFRIFITAFLGFFVSYVIIATMVIFDRSQISNRVSQLMTALFAAIGNKTVIDYFPTQTNYSFSDLIQMSSFAIIIAAIFQTVLVTQLDKMEKGHIAALLDKWFFVLVTPAYPLLVGYGLYAALNSIANPFPF